MSKTERLYYNDSYLLQFEAQVIEQTQVDDCLVVALSQSAFYPTGGGQPHDVGLLNDVPVVDVVGDDNGLVLHVTERPIDGRLVQGQINWSRRFDHMRHHTGQHILTRAFINVAEAETVGFHLSDNSVTIDLDRTDLSVADVDAAEDLANQIVAENRMVRAWFPTDEELAALELRKISEKVTDAVRVVDVGGFDQTACGGTHVAFTGEIGVIKVLRVDRLKGKYMRVEFRCGDRALRDYRQKNGLLNDLAAQMTTGYDQIPVVLDKMREENKALKRALKAVRRELVGYHGANMWQASRQEDGWTVISHVVDDYDASDLQQLASQLTQNPQTVVMLGIYGDPAHMVCARSADVDLDVVSLLKAGLAVLGSQRGGGRPEMAQGGGVAATKAQVEAALASMMDGLRSR